MNSQLAANLLPDQTELRKQILTRFAGIFERQVRAKQYAQNVNELVQVTHAEVMALLQESVRDIDAIAMTRAEKQKITTGLASAVSRFSRLNTTLDLLLSDQLQQWQFTHAGLHEVMRETNRTAKDLSATLVEKALFERHAQILESVVLSHEKITRWEQHVKEILTRFHSIIPASLFYVVFEEQGSYSLYLYFMERFLDADKIALRENMLARLQARLGWSPEMSCTVHEFELDDIALPSFSVPLASLELMSMPIPSLDALMGSGMLGVAHADRAGISAQAASVIRSILSVMVMVVGSSKALGRTLSDLEYFSTHDPLTGLNNRRYFNDILQVEQARSQRHGHEFSVLMVDLDDFKDVNDTYGHPCGDMVLKRVAEEMLSPMRVGDTVTRIGGDEFAIILSETGAEGARNVAEKLCKQIHDLVFCCENGIEFHITASIGVITYPGNAKTLSDLIAGADQSLYRAKQQGKDSVISLESVQDVLHSSRLTRGYAEKLRHCLNEGRVIPHYQPIVNCQTGELFAYEALARVREPDGEIIAAGSFIETIEKYGMGRELDRAIIRRALEDLRAHIAVHGFSFELFINLSAQEINSRGILAYAEQVCIELDIPLNLIVFEITERDAISDMTRMRAFIDDLRRKGFLFALDDFGSGYNSFHYLRELSFDFVKIDGDFVKNILSSKTDQILVHNLSRLCQDLGVRTIAEFVESEKVLRMLRAMGVDYVQGYHLGRPASHFE